MQNNQHVDYDAIVVGAGFAGITLIHYLREAGLSLKVFDRATDIGGTWAWNKYPGAATDSEGYYYCLTFSEEVLQEWTWSRRYPGWKETQNYLRFVADKFDMWRDIQFDTEIKSAEYQDNGTWLVTTGSGETYTCRYFISGMGMISEPQIPNLKGMDTLKGPYSTPHAGPRNWNMKASVSASSEQARPPYKCFPSSPKSQLTLPCSSERLIS